ncbi:MAG: hypothetical protein Q7S34_01680 [bacterium]|nr:hypothetical protein [bacterium]
MPKYIMTGDTPVNQGLATNEDGKLFVGKNGEVPWEQFWSVHDFADDETALTKLTKFASDLGIMNVGIGRLIAVPSWVDKSQQS